MKFKRLLLGLCSVFTVQFSVADQAELGSVIFDKVEVSEQGESLASVSGRITGGTPASSLDINGYVASLYEENKFVVDVTRSSVYEVYVYRADGGYEELQYATSQSPVSPAIQAAIGPGFLEKAKEPLAELITNLDLAEVLNLGDERCAVDTPILMGCDLYIRQLILRSTPVIDEVYTIPGNGERLRVHLEGQVASADLRGALRRLFWGYRETTFNLQNLDFAVEFDVVPAPSGSIRLETDNASVDVSIGGIRVVESNNLAAYLAPLLKGPIELLLNQRLLLSIVGPYLEDLPVALSPGQLSLDIDGDGEQDGTFSFDFSVDVLDVLEDGSPFAQLSGSVSATNPVPERDSLGSRRRNSEGTMLGASQLSVPADVNVRINVDFVNQALLAIYQSGLERNLEVFVGVDLFERLTSQLIGLGVDPGSDIKLQLVFGGVPEIVASTDGVNPLGLKVLLPQATLIISGQQEGEDLLLLSAAGDFLLDSSVGIGSDGELALEFGDELVEANITAVNGGKLYEAVGASLPPEILYEVLGGVVPVLVAELEPAILFLLNAFPLGLDLGSSLGEWLMAEIPSRDVEANLIDATTTEAGNFDISFDVNFQP